MNIDRSRFLLLAAALSANACTIIDNRGHNDAAVADDTGSADTGTTADDTGSPIDGGDASLDASDAASDGETGDAALCTDEGITVPACSPTGTGCATDGGNPACSTITSYFKPKAAKLAVDCLNALPTCEGTTTDPVWDCAYSALEGACPDSTVTSYCDGLAAACAADGGADAGTDLKAACLKSVGGLTTGGRTRLTALVTAEGGCATPLRDLLQNL